MVASYTVSDGFPQAPPKPNSGSEGLHRRAIGLAVARKATLVEFAVCARKISAQGRDDSAHRPSDPELKATDGASSVTFCYAIHSISSGL